MSVLSDKLWLSDRGRLEHRQAAEFCLDWAETWLDEHPEFEIIPRNPETYKDWQVGDVVARLGCNNIQVAARLGELVFCTEEENGHRFACDFFNTGEELYMRGYRLVLTDYEKELAEAKNAHSCAFKVGDMVLMRHNDNEPWRAGTFQALRIIAGNCTSECIYEVKILYNNCYPFQQCIPYNEKTWKLLGTTDDYKEEITKTNKTKEE